MLFTIILTYLSKVYFIYVYIYKEKHFFQVLVEFKLTKKKDKSSILILLFSNFSNLIYWSKKNCFYFFFYAVNANTIPYKIDFMLNRIKTLVKLQLTIDIKIKNIIEKHLVIDQHIYMLYIYEKREWEIKKWFVKLWELIILFLIYDSFIIYNHYFLI